MSSVDSSRARRFSLWAPVVAYCVAIFFVSNLSFVPMPEQVSDKSGHFAAYAGLAILAVRAVGGGLPCRVGVRVAVLAFAIAGGYGASDEIHQYFVPGRSADIADWYADLTGAAVGIVVGWLWGIIASRSDV